MTTARRRTPTLPLFAALVAAAALGACSEDPYLGPEDPALAPLVGNWEAISFRVAPAAAPALGFDVIEEGGSFDLGIEPSGRYSAVLFLLGLSSTELGLIEVQGDQLIQTPTSPPADPITVTWELLNNELLLLEGEGEFDFNIDGTPEPALVRIELLRQPEG